MQRFWHLQSLLNNYWGRHIQIVCCTRVAFCAGNVHFPPLIQMHNDESFVRAELCLVIWWQGHGHPCSHWYFSRWASNITERSPLWAESIICCCFLIQSFSSATLHWWRAVVTGGHVSWTTMHLSAPVWGVEGRRGTMGRWRGTWLQSKQINNYTTHKLVWPMVRVCFHSRSDGTHSNAIFRVQRIMIRQVQWRLLWTS